jgi:hypothetical protein
MFGRELQGKRLLGNMDVHNGIILNGVLRMQDK